jgi:hypothetical protein
MHDGSSLHRVASLRGCLASIILLPCDTGGARSDRIICNCDCRVGCALRVRISATLCYAALLRAEMQQPRHAETLKLMLAAATSKHTTAKSQPTSRHTIPCSISMVWQQHNPASTAQHLHSVAAASHHQLHSGPATTWQHGMAATQRRSRASGTTSTATATACAWLQLQLILAATSHPSRSCCMDAGAGWRST